MSAYPSYSQTPSTSGYYQPPPPAQPTYQQYSGYYQQPVAQPTPVPYNDEHFRHDYSRRLAALTFNSRPLIQELSILAQTYAQTVSRIVVECIEQQLRRAPAEHKLPTFYLLDSIVKNCPEPYISLFTPIIHRLFLDVFNSVDESTKTKMREMLVTWRTGLAGGAPVFQNAILDMIERGVYDRGYRNNGPRKPTPQQVWTELEVVFSTKERMARDNPHDEVTRKHLEILTQLRTMVPKMSPDELTSVLTRLREMARSSSNSSAPPPPPMHPPPAPVSVPGYPYGVAPPTPYAYPPMQPTQVAPQTSQFASLLQSLGIGNQGAPAVPAAAPSANPLVNSANLSALLSTLQGRLGNFGAASAASTPPPPPSDPSKMTQEEYEDRVLSFRVGTSTGDLMRTKPQILPFLYVKSAPQCSECGMRFPAGEHGKQLLRDHLDKHFRQNVKANENIGRGTSRSWFVGRTNWVSDVPELAGNKPNARTGGKLSEKAKAEAAIQLRKELEAKLVVVPPGSEGKSATCRICMEDIPIEFDEDEEQWVWRNAVMQNEKVYHATCHHDISKRREDARLSASGSRQGTPDVGMLTPQKARFLLLSDDRSKSDSPKPASRSTPPKPSPLAGSKRKQQDVEGTDIVQIRGVGTIVKQEPIDERPLKKAALEVPVQVAPAR